MDVYKMRSVSSETNSRMDIELIQGANTDFIALELNEKLAVIRKNQPYGTSLPKVTLALSILLVFMVTASLFESF